MSDVWRASRVLCVLRAHLIFTVPALLFTFYNTVLSLVTLASGKSSDLCVWILVSSRPQFEPNITLLELPFLPLENQDATSKGGLEC